MYRKKDYCKFSWFKLKNLKYKNYTVLEKPGIYQNSKIILNSFGD